MNNLRYTLAVAGKELQVMLKDRGSLVVLFLLPLLLASLLGSMFQASTVTGDDEEETISLDVFLVNNDDGEYAKQVVSALRSIDELNITTLTSVTRADERVADAQALAAIIIPADFSQKIDAYEATEVQVIVDPAQEVAAGIISGIMNQVLSEVEVVGEVSYGIRSVFAESGVLEGAPPEMQRAAEAQTLGAIMTQLQGMRLNPTIAVQSEDMAGVEAAGPINLFGYIVPNFHGDVFLFSDAGTGRTTAAGKRGRVVPPLDCCAHPTGRDYRRQNAGLHADCRAASCPFVWGGQLCF